MNSVTKTVLAIAAAATATGGLATPAFAQRDPAYAAARSAGQVGERMDGYLGIVVAETPALRRIVNDINIKRRAVYSERAKATNATIEEYAFTAGCQAILATVSGEKYQAPDGSWQTRGANAPLRDPRCP
ncbi:YdbL family protein [Qipengyuania flava]|uniref:YdbL family protein n=1 Tax=Qipengyuania flava TaxID=192812 RepID=UPI00273E625E|nr:YdbL family protein [Qipengyuania flava]